MSVRTSDEGIAARELNPDSIADRTTVGVFFRQAARYGDRPLINYRAGEAWKVATWTDMRRNILAVASALVEAGIKQGDCVVLMGAILRSRPPAASRCRSIQELCLRWPRP